MTSQIPMPTTSIVTPAQAAPSIPAFGPKTETADSVAQPQTLTPIDVSPNNPCPFLRGLVAQGLLPNDQASLQQVADAIHRIQDGQDLDAQGNRPKLPTAMIKLIAATANGFSPSQVFSNVQQGVKLSHLRGSPFDKRGGGSRILSQTGEYAAAELARLATFASPKTTATGASELGLDAQQIQTMLDANAERAHNQQRLFDRMIMNGEFPILLKVLGKQGQTPDGNPVRYLAVDDVARLFQQRQFPERIAARIQLQQR